jgi:ATP synthase in type III secretion protein N
VNQVGRVREILDGSPSFPREGSLVDVAPGRARCVGAGARLGEVVRVASRSNGFAEAEVVAVHGSSAILLPLSGGEDLVPGGEVLRTGRPLQIRVGRPLLGRVLDGLGRPMDGRPLPRGLAAWEVDRPAPAPMARARLDRQFPTGVRALDAFATLAEGQRVGLFAGPGVGKSSLLGRLARGGGAEVCVLGLVGERGREVREMVEDVLGAEGISRSVVVAATSDAPAAARVRSAQVATAIAEWFARVDGRRVLLLVDSLTRFARAIREVGLAAGEPPVRQGYPSRVFSELPRLLERAGTGPGGPITAVYTVLSSGDSAEDPLSAEIQGLLDGHLVLDRRIAEGGRFPALDVLASLSRAMPAVAGASHRAAAARVRAAMARWESARELIAAGAWVRGADEGLDEAVAAMPAIEAFLREDGGGGHAFEETVRELGLLASGIRA